MPVKDAVLEYLGERALSAPQSVSAGLAANDRAKVRMAALQLAGGGGDPASRNLDQEAAAARLDPEALRRLLRQARAMDGQVLLAPGLGDLLKALGEDLEVMLQSVEALDGAEDPGLTARWSELKAGLIPTGPDQIAAATVSRITALPKAGGDSIHRLVMDLHKRLNHAAAAQASETIAGAKAIGLRPEDRAPLLAFMRGLERTRPLKFDHPGLDTTAARSGERLLIQNDIGTTDAHVVVTAVEPGSVTITYTDVHRARARFLIRLLGMDGLVWSGLEERQAPGLAGGDSFYLVTGRLVSDDIAQRDDVLERLGAGLVFLIDWNKARKALAGLSDKPGAERVLLWAARHGAGHRAWLQLGGVDLIAQAVRQVAPGRLGFGARLDQVLGHEGTVEFLQACLQLAADVLRQGGSERLVRDRIGAELLRRIERAEAAVFLGVIRQAGLAREIGAAILARIEALRRAGADDDAGWAARAKRIEAKADRLAIEGRAAARAAGLVDLLPIIDGAEQAVDELEQAAFIASILPSDVGEAVLAGLSRLCRLAMSAAEALVTAADASIDCPEGRQVDADDALAALTAVVDCEQAADRLEREVFAAGLTADRPAGALIAALETARGLERSTDWIARAGDAIRRNLMTDLGG
ncbi:MAG: hypothetical protein P4L64_09935 [Caulobacteraceae bacterium]|nr:hypothetical protein [Caulobacteraceae bacterium]